MEKPSGRFNFTVVAGVPFEMLIHPRAAGTNQWHWSACPSGARRRPCGHMDEYFTTPFLLADLHILCVRRADSPGRTFNDTLMAEGVACRCSGLIKINGSLLLLAAESIWCSCWVTWRNSLRSADASQTLDYSEETAQGSRKKQQLASFKSTVPWFCSFSFKRCHGPSSQGISKHRFQSSKVGFIFQKKGSTNK